MPSLNKSLVPSLGGVPRAYLLPPEVVERLANQSRTRILGLIVGAVLVVMLAGFGLTVALAASAQASLAASQNESQTLIAQQTSYADTTSANESIAQITEAQKVVTSSEVLWSDLHATVEQSVPSGDRITLETFTGRAPFDPVLVVPTPIGSPKVASISVTVNMSSPDDVNTFVTSLRKNDVVSNVSTASLIGLSGQYTAQFRIDFNVKALANRFAQEASK